MWIKNLSQIYGLLVCFVCSLISLVCFGIILNSTMEILFVETMHPEIMSRYANNETYLRHFWDERPNEQKE